MEKTVPKLKFWDVPNRCRNLNLPSSTFGRVPNNSISSLIKNGCFATGSSSLLPKIRNDNDQDKSPPCTSNSHNFKPLSKRKNCEKPEEVHNKKTKFAKSISTYMESFVSNASDQNILKSVKTYAKKTESWAGYNGTLNCNVENSNSSSDETNSVKKNQCSLLKHENGYVDSINNIDNVTNESIHEEYCLFGDVLFSESDSNLFECSNELETVDSIIKERETTDNSYVRTRKNLKSHVGRGRKPNCSIEPSSTVNKSKAMNTVSKVANKKKVQVHKLKAIARVSPTVRKPEATEIPMSRINTPSNNSTERGRRKVTSPNLSSLCPQSFSNEHVKKYTVSNCASVPVPSSSNKHTRRAIKFSTPKGESILNMANKLSSNLQTKDSSPRSATNDLKINVNDCCAPEINSSKKSNLLNDENKLDSISSLHNNLSNRLTHLLTNDPSPTSSASEFKGTNKCNKNNSKIKKKAPQVNTHSINESTNSDVYHQIVDIFTNPRQDFYNCLAEVDENSNKPLLKCINATNGTSLFQRQQSVPALIEPSKNKATSFDGDSNSAKCLLLSASPKKFCSSHICTKLKPINLPFLMCDCNNPNSTSNTNTDLLSLAAEINNYTLKVISMATEEPQKVPSQVSRSELCERVQNMFLPKNTGYDCAPPDPQHLKSNSPTSKNEICNSSLDTLNKADEETDTQSRNCKWKSKQDTLNHGGASDFNYKELPTDTENNCAPPDSQHLKTNSSTSDNESCNSSLGTSTNNTDLEADINIQKRDSNWVSMCDTQNHSASSDLNYKESESVPKPTLADTIQEQNGILLQNALKHLNFISNYCLTKLYYDYAGDNFEQKSPVKKFCEDPRTIEVLSKFLSDIEALSVSSTTVKLQYKFPINFQNMTLSTVIGEYMKFFIYKIFPLDCETIKSQSVLHFAKENMSAFEISAVARFFNESGVLKPTDFISRFTYVALVVLYKEYQLRKVTDNS